MVGRSHSRSRPHHPTGLVPGSEARRKSPLSWTRLWSALRRLLEVLSRVQFFCFINSLESIPFSFLHCRYDGKEVTDVRLDGSKAESRVPPLLLSIGSLPCFLYPLLTIRESHGFLLHAFSFPPLYFPCFVWIG